MIGEIEADKRHNDLTAAERAFRDSLTLAVAHGMRPLEAHCHLGLGRLFAATGDKAKAKEHLGTAAAMMRGMEVGVWLGHAETAPAETAA